MKSLQQSLDLGTQGRIIAAFTVEKIGTLFYRQVCCSLKKCFQTFEVVIAHGIDHLSGADDATPRERRRMHRRELRWLERAHQLGLLGTLLAPGGPT